MSLRSSRGHLTFLHLLNLTLLAHLTSSVTKDDQSQALNHDQPKALAISPANESSIAKFLREPELGTSWYNPAGPTPTFFEGQKNGTVYRSRLGEDGLLSCHVTSLEDNLVVWARKQKNGVPIILTIGFRPHHADERFILDFEPPNNYRLRIREVQWKDEGIYICQLTVHPPRLLWSRLELNRPVVHLLDGDGNPVRDLHYESGSNIDLLCRIRRPPLYQVSVIWEARKLSEDGSFYIQTFNKDVIRGGVKVETGRDQESGYVVSKLSLAKAISSDTGNYSCRMEKIPEYELERHLETLKDFVYIHVLRAENTEAIQSAASSSIVGTTFVEFRIISILCLRYLYEME